MAALHDLQDLVQLLNTRLLCGAGAAPEGGPCLVHPICTEPCLLSAGLWGSGWTCAHLGPSGRQLRTETYCALYFCKPQPEHDGEGCHHCGVCLREA